MNKIKTGAKDSGNLEKKEKCLEALPKGAICLLNKGDMTSLGLTSKFCLDRGVILEIEKGAIPMVGGEGEVG